MRKILTIISICISFWAFSATYGIKDIPNVQLQDHTKHLVNPDGIISPAVQAQIDTLLLDARRKSSAEIVAVVVDYIDTDDIDCFATDLINTWGIGKSDKNNGILLIVAKDGRAATIRTGYGAEGVMPDIIAGRIIRDTMIPYFKNGDYEGGVLAGVQEIHKVVTDPEAISELHSSKTDKRQSGDGIDAFAGYAFIGALVAVALLIYLFRKLYSYRGMSNYDKYVMMKKYKITFWVIALLFLGIPILAPLILTLLLSDWRNGKHICPSCGAKMTKLAEDVDNQYLSAAQDMEERLNSVDYDVWKCPQCGETDVYSFVNDSSTYKECGYCHARALKLASTSVIKDSTSQQEGIGLRNYVCLNCKQHVSEKCTIAKKVAQAAPIIIPGSGRGFGGGGGFSGGSFSGGFGGGMSGGGGATGRW